jgi:hypothetical protein
VVVVVGAAAAVATVVVVAPALTYVTAGRAAAAPSAAGAGAVEDEASDTAAEGDLPAGVAPAAAGAVVVEGSIEALGATVVAVDPRRVVGLLWTRRAAVVTDATKAMSASVTANTAHQRGRSAARTRASRTDVARPFSSTAQI